MTKLQLDLWKNVPLAVNTQPDISNVGNREVQDMCVRAGCWLRSDSIVIEEPIQIEELANRPPWLATIMEDGYYRQYKVDPTYLPIDESGMNVLEKWMLHSIDLGANYWSLWTESDNLRRYYERYPNGFDTLQRRLGYRLRPSWIWQRKRFERMKLSWRYPMTASLASQGSSVYTSKAKTEEFNERISGCWSALCGKIRQASLLPKGSDGLKPEYGA
jgi:hypothetical protein